MGQRTNSVTYRFSVHLSIICIVYFSPPAAVVEQVVNGSTFRAFLLPSDVSPTYQYVTLLLSGVRAPSARLGEDKAFQGRGQILRRVNFVETPIS